MAKPDLLCERSRKSDRIAELAAPYRLRPRRPAGLGFAPDPCLLACNALHCHALQLEKSHGGSGRKDEDNAAAAARTGAARVASRRCRPPLAGGATTSGEAGRRPRPGSRARRVEMDRIGLRV